MLKQVGNMRVTTPSDREIALVRDFDAPRRMVFAALTRPELIRRWLLGPPGWSMPICEFDARVGGKFRYGWTREDGASMSMSGTISEFIAPERIVADEVFDDPWYEGVCIDTTVLTEKAGGTTLSITTRYDTQAIRDGVLEGPMADGMEMGYERLAALLTTLRPSDY